MRIFAEILQHWRLGRPWARWHWGGRGWLAIGTQSGSGTGNAFAGGAAAADDASVAWFNPALMTLLPGKQVAGALHVLKPSFKFENTASTSPIGTGEGGDGGDWAFISPTRSSPGTSPGIALRGCPKRALRPEDRIRRRAGAAS